MTLDHSNFHFGLCSTEILSGTSLNPQNSLHLTLDTTINFTTIVNDVQCTIRFVFRPFRRDCNLTYHEYEIQCSIPSGKSETTVCKQSIIEVAQQLYEQYFFKNAGYRLALLESE